MGRGSGWKGKLFLEEASFYPSPFTFNPSRKVKGNNR
jgi:hypothetical protein